MRPGHSCAQNSQWLSTPPNQWTPLTCTRRSPHHPTRWPPSSRTAVSSNLRAFAHTISSPRVAVHSHIPVLKHPFLRNTSPNTSVFSVTHKAMLPLCRRNTDCGYSLVGYWIKVHLLARTHLFILSYPLCLAWLNFLLNGQVTQQTNKIHRDVIHLHYVKFILSDTRS